MNTREHQRTEEIYKEKLSRLMREAELDIKTVIKARDAVWAALPYRWKEEVQNRQRANNLIGELFAGSFTDGEIHSAEVIKLLADPREAEAWVGRLSKLPDSSFLAKGAQDIRTVGAYYAKLLFDQENEGNV